MEPNKPRFKIAAFAAGVIVLLWLGWLVYQNSYFHIVSTNPRSSRVAAVSTFIKINFNRQLVASGASISSSPEVIASYSINSHTLVINLKGPMDTSQLYKINIARISDEKGEIITNKVISFTPKKIQSQDLSPEQKQAFLKQQTYHPPSKTNIVFGGIDAFTNYGLTEGQLSDLEKAFYKFSPNSKKVSFPPADIKPVPHDPNSSSVSTTINFTAQIDSTPYKALIDFSNLTKLELILYSPTTGAQVYDSGVLDSSSS